MYKVDDVKDLYIEDMKDKKSTNRSSRSYSKRRKGRVHLEHDNLTNSQLKSLNGPVQTYQLGKPMTIHAFVAMPSDLQGMYIKRLREKFGATNEDIAGMFDIYVDALESYFKTQKIPVVYFGKNNFDPESWKELLKDWN